MPRRSNDQQLENEPPKKKISHTSLSIGPKQNEVLQDIHGSKWKLGKTVGIGGFGEIYLASPKTTIKEVKNDTPFVAKIEPHSNGPLFVEVNCYLRVAKEDCISKWIADKKLKYLGLPRYVASGSHVFNNERYRFLIVPRFDRDLESLLKVKERFNIKTVLTIAKQILNVLEYIHSHGYVHSDIKASNIMLGGQNKDVKEKKQTTRKTVLRSQRIKMKKQVQTRVNKNKRNLRNIENVNYIDDIPYFEEILRSFEEEGKELNKIVEKHLNKEQNCENEVYLIDYGLACKYILTNGEHRKFLRDERKAHAGTLMFCSRDAHFGVPSRRSDMESLAYNMVYWLTGFLPWIENIEQPEMVEKKKNRCFKEYKAFLNVCFNNDCPQFMFDFFAYLNRLEFEDKPDYKYCRNLFKKAIQENGYKDDSRLDFDDVETSHKGRIKKIRSNINGRENRMINANILSGDSMRPPLLSNIIYKRPKLRKKTKNQQPICDSMMNWSKILTDPENILKQGSKKRSIDDECHDEVDLSDIDIESMNPTYAMLEVYNNYMGNRSGRKHDNLIEGFTPAMMAVHLKKKHKTDLERRVKAVIKKPTRRLTRVSKPTLKIRESPIKKSTSRNKSLSNNCVKKETVKKRNVPTPRHKYSLRG